MGSRPRVRVGLGDGEHAGFGLIILDQGTGRGRDGTMALEPLGFNSRLSGSRETRCRKTVNRRGVATEVPGRTAVTVNGGLSQIAQTLIRAIQARQPVQYTYSQWSR